MIYRRTIICSSQASPVSELVILDEGVAYLSEHIAGNPGSQTYNTVMGRPMSYADPGDTSRD